MAANGGAIAVPLFDVYLEENVEQALGARVSIEIEVSILVSYPSITCAVISSTLRCSIPILSSVRPGRQ
jgi:hypothetical protein